MTDLYSAFSPLSGNNGAMTGDFAGADFAEVEQPQAQPRRSMPIKQAAAAPSQKQLPAVQQSPPLPTPSLYDGGATFNKQFEQEQKIAMLVNELKRRKGGNGGGAGEESYFDKLMGKKKELMKFLQSGLIVLFAFSMHFVIDHYLKYYLESNAISFEREVFLRVLYPVAVLFLAWNLITFNK